MTSVSEGPLTGGRRWATRILAGGVSAVALSGIAGWLLDVPALTRVAPAYVPIAPSSSVAFLALGLAILAIELWGDRRPVAVIVGTAFIIVVSVACQVLLQATFGIDIGLETALCRAVGAPAIYPLARMSPIVAPLLLLAVMATALGSPWARRWRYSNDVSAGLAALVLAGDLIITLSYLLGSPLLYPGPIRPVALPASVAFILLSLALLTQRLSSARNSLPAHLSLIIGVVVSFGVFATVEATERASGLPHVVWHGRVVLLGGLSLTAVQFLYLLRLARYHTRIDAASKALQTTEARHRAVIDTASDAIITVDATGAVVYWNRAAARIFDRPAEAIVGQPVTLLIPGRFQADHLAGMLGASESGESRLIGRTVELVGVRRDGHEFPVELSVARWSVAGETYFTAVIRDITERQRLEAKVAHAQKLEAIAKLAAGVAHNLNNLLQGMMGTAGLLRSHAVDATAVREDASALEGQVRRAAAVSRQLMLFARQELAQLGPVDLNEIVAASSPFIRGFLPANVVLSLKTTVEPLVVEADSAQLEQVLINLVENASEAMPDGGSLTVRTGSGGDSKVWLEVADTGSGIATEHLGRIFEPFFSTKGTEKGSGLGLSVVHGIVHGHGGEIFVESAVGRGATFRVVLPLAAGSRIPSGDKILPAPDVGRGERVLVVDDEDAVRDSLAATLDLLGYAPTTAATGEEAERLSAMHRFDLLLTDLLLPGVGGGELARRLLERSSGLRVILMSGFTEDEEVKRMVRQGTMRFLQKPFDIDTLARNIRAALGSDSPSG